MSKPTALQFNVMLTQFNVKWFLKFDN